MASMSKEMFVERQLPLILDSLFRAEANIVWAGGSLLDIHTGNIDKIKDIDLFVPDDKIYPLEVILRHKYGYEVDEKLESSVRIGENGISAVRTMSSKSFPIPFDIVGIYKGEVRKHIDSFDLATSQIWLGSNLRVVRSAAFHESFERREVVVLQSHEDDALMPKAVSLARQKQTSERLLKVAEKLGWSHYYIRESARRLSVAGLKERLSKIGY